MLELRFLFFTFFLLLSAKVYGQKSMRLQAGTWSASLQLNDSTKLNFNLLVKKVKGSYTVAVQNAEEVITLGSFIKKGDSVSVAFPNFHSNLQFKVLTRKSMAGKWTNFNKGASYQIPFSAQFSKIQSDEAVTHSLAGKWKTEFSPNTADSYFAVGMFKQKEERLTGTFLTETGDYRFLDGKISGNKFSVSAFDGSHAFLFTGFLRNDSIFGRFYSGIHYSTLWQAVRDEKFQLAHPDSLTYLVKKEIFSFKAKDLTGADFTFPATQFTNKVTIIQIMGTWCPNCMDETMFFKDLYAKYHDKGLEIISIGYETPNEFEQQAEKIKRLKERHQLNFTFLVGGKANKSLASQQFSMLNEIISFPTAIFIGRDGTVQKIHTGFNGPGTGEIYQQYIQETSAFIEELLK
jgi:thiol-disulfide isomerase/thioredoxin